MIDDRDRDNDEHLNTKALLERMMETAAEMN
jgi:hypothetical protein